MSIPEMIVDKLKNFEYEKNGCGSIVGDIYALIYYINILEAENADLKIEAREKNAWEGRYNALLEQAEASRQPLIYDGEASRGKPSGTVALDVNGYPWLCDEGGWWKLVKDTVQGKRSELSPIVGPYAIVYIPGEREQIMREEHQAWLAGHPHRTHNGTLT